MPGDGDGPSHRVHVVASNLWGSEAHHLVRLRREADHTVSYVWKSFSDFEVLMRQLQKCGGIELLPEARDKGGFGSGKATSFLANSNDALSNEARRLEMSVDFVLGQVASLHDNIPLANFFRPSPDALANDTIALSLERLRGNLDLLTISGFWRPERGRVWSLSDGGTAHLDGQYFGAGYDVHEGPDRSLFRKDGWSVDLDRSACKEKLIWVKPGENSEMVWTRLTREEAQPVIDRAEESRIKAEKRAADNAANKTGLASEPIA